MKKRNFVAILMVTIGLFASVSLFATNDQTSPVDGKGGPTGTNTVSGVYVPD